MRFSQEYLTGRFKIIIFSQNGTVIYLELTVDELVSLNIFFHIYKISQIDPILWVRKPQSSRVSGENAELQMGSPAHCAHMTILT